MRAKLGIFVLTAATVGLLLAAESTTKPAQKATPAPARSSATAKAAAPHAVASAGAPTQAAYDKAVKPLFDSTCSMCHTGASASGGLDISAFSTVGSMKDDRDECDKIAHRSEAGEMPPPSLIPHTD